MSFTTTALTEPLVANARRIVATHAACQDRCVSVEHVRGGKVPVLRYVLRTGVELIVVAGNARGEEVTVGAQLIDGAVADDGTGHLTFATHPGVVTVPFSKLRAL